MKVDRAELGTKFSLVSATLCKAFPRLMYGALFLARLAYYSTLCEAYSLNSMVWSCKDCRLTHLQQTGDVRHDRSLRSDRKDVGVVEKRTIVIYNTYRWYCHELYKGINTKCMYGIQMQNGVSRLQEASIEY